MLAQNFAVVCSPFPLCFDTGRYISCNLACALARLQYARADALAGESVKAEEYANFFTLWKDADPDIPILKQAKAEYARLQ